MIEPRPPLIAAGGALVARSLISDAWFDALQREGLAARSMAREQRKGETGTRGGQGDNPARHLASAPGGPVQAAIYADASLRSELSRLAGHRLRPTGGQGSFSYYDRPGHFLGLHRDIRRCDLTLLICLHRVEGTEPSGALRLYPKALAVPLSRIAADAPFRDIRMQPGDAVLLLGGCIPHEVMPAAPGFDRAVSVLCYEVAGDDHPVPEACRL